MYTRVLRVNARVEKKYDAQKSPSPSVSKCMLSTRLRGSFPAFVEITEDDPEMQSPPILITHANAISFIPSNIV